MPSTGPSRATKEDLNATDAFLASVLKGERPAMPGRMDILADRALYHGVTALLTTQTDIMSALPAEVRDALRQQALAETMWDLRHRQVLRPVLDQLAEAGIRAALLKGTALACTTYASPSLRPRGDTDLLVSVSDLEHSRAVLRLNGFHRASEHDMDRMPQEEWVMQSADGSMHCIDLHWNLLRPWALANLFSTTELLESSIPVPAMGPGCLALDPAMALLHACAHRASHFSGAYFIGSEAHYGGDRLIWFVDMKLLSEKLDAAGWQAFHAKALATATARICGDTLSRCKLLIGGEIPDSLIQSLLSEPGPSPAEDYFLHRSLAGRMWADMRALPARESKLAYLREILFPSEKIMRQAYPDLAHKSLARLHFHRYFERFRRLRRARQQQRRSQ